MHPVPKKQFFRDFLVILKRMHQNYSKIIKKCLLVILTVVNVWMLQWNDETWRIRTIKKDESEQRIIRGYCTI